MIIRRPILQYLTVSSLLFMLLSCNSSNETANYAVKSEAKPIGQFKGYTAIENHLNLAIMPADIEMYRKIRLEVYLGDSLMLPLLGSYSDDGSNSEYRNGAPTPVNTLLWQNALSKLAENLAQSCEADKIYAPGDSIYLSRDYNKNFASILAEICMWPLPNAKNEDALLNLWLIIMGFEAPESEYKAWRDFYLDKNSPFANADAQTTSTSMFKTMFLNPYFLLEQ
ncbi:MAG: hypothetical protein KBD78_02135 [Oligoflexales bacterium]|nr:hypothetical protein [Oligoflexales bacterium]